MALTTAQRLAVKKHLGEHPDSTIIDPFITAIEDGGAMEDELVAAVTACDTALAAYFTAADAADELVAGGGAKFSYERRLSIKQQAYRARVADLARIIMWPLPGLSGTTAGFLSV